MNDVLMILFFFLVGMEIKKELAIGELSSKERALFPLLAAFGGVIFPAIIYLFFNYSLPSSRGWAIPTATDIAFAVAIISLCNVPRSLKIFLLALAIVDDLIAVTIIAFFYTKNLHFVPIAISIALIAIITFLKIKKVSFQALYTLIGILFCFAIFKSGIHSTVAGVILAFLVPTKSIDYFIQKIHPTVVFVIMPLFAFMNGGVRFVDIDLHAIFQNPIYQGVSVGLLIGKPIGIFLFSFLIVKCKIAKMPEGSNWLQVLAVAMIAGIGFTMSLFISNLALNTEEQSFAKAGILVGSLASAWIGLILLKSQQIEQLKEK